MLRLPLLFFIIILYSISLSAQVTKADYYNVIDNKVFTFSKQKPNAPFDTITAFVNATFQSQEDRARAYYTWIALNISYDVEHMNELNLLKTYNVSSISSYNQKSADVLKNKKAVCEGYSNLMVDFCATSSIPCFLVCGYTKTPGGDIPDILHAWNVLRIDSAWCMLDITWSSGYVNPMNTFVKRFSNLYFLPKPKNFIKDHLPLDPMWQLLKNPFTKKDFENDSLVVSHSSVFNFPDSIKAYRAYPLKQRQYIDFLHYYRAEPDNKDFARNLDVLNNNLIVDDLNRGVAYQTDFLDIANKKLTKKPTMADYKKAKAILDTVQFYNKKALFTLNKSKAHTTEYEFIFNNIHKTIEENDRIIMVNYDYLKKLRTFLSNKK
jgi:Transglutaminase-like superfamily